MTVRASYVASVSCGVKGHLGTKSLLSPLAYPNPKPKLEYDQLKLEWRSQWSSQLYTQLKQLWNLSLKKKIQTWIGFEPMTSVISLWCSTNWAIKPTGSLSHCEFIIDGEECKGIKNANVYTGDWSLMSSYLSPQLKYNWSFIYSFALS